jgi:hypothetical protein
MSYITYVTLLSTNDGSFIADPTVVAGDFKISKDGGAYVNLTNLPAATPAGSPGVKIELTDDEIDAVNVNIWAVDAAGNEWHDVFIPLSIADMYNGLRVKELWQLQGLDGDNPMTVSTALRTADVISLAITGDGRTTSTVSRN